MALTSIEPSARRFAVDAAWRRWARRVAAALAAAATLAYVGAVAFMGARQESLIFAPDVLPASHRFAFGDDVHELAIDVPGATLSALHLRLPRPRGVVFYLHGNTGSLDRWFAEAEWFRRANFDLFMLDYRGYGKSSGRIESEAQMHDDVRAAWARIAPLYEGKARVILGRSLGSALAARLAAAVAPDVTVLVSPCRSLAALVAQRHPWLPAFVLRYPLHTDAAVSQLHTPLVLLHGERDGFIAPEHSQALARLATGARLLLVPGAGHADIVDGAGYRAALRAELDRL